MVDQSMAAGAATADEAAVGDYFALLKPRVMTLVVFTGLVGLVMAPGTLHPILALTALLCIGVGAGAAGCLNMWWESDLDSAMERTAARPIPAGRVGRDEALGFGVTLSVASVVVMDLATNHVAAALLALAIVFYVGVYTMVLKRRTPQNIVIGGAAGALPPMIGWAAVTGSLSIEPIVLFAIIFFWTPPHFWALALLRAHEYARAGVPMLPCVAGDDVTRRQIVVYTLLVSPLALAPTLMGFAGPLYGAVAGVLGAAFIVLALRLARDGARRQAVQMFAFSILYLFALFATLLAEYALGLPTSGWSLG
ncbi:heme o synthase [Zavarzinia sp. CC-PAN008]|uniref:heme o synthase n=1 Tax=Zavarzinia sp. CC-PAN008 TaxID=3243332 RepID=UPI003F745453